MNEDVLKCLQEIMYYYEEYQNGSEEAYIALYELARAIKTSGKDRTRYAILFSILEMIQRLKVNIINPSLNEEDSYKELIGFCKDDLDYYKEISRYLRDYAKYCMYTDDFEHLDKAFLLTVELSCILTNISSYYEHINTILSTSVKGFTYFYPANVKDKHLSTREDIEKLVKQLTIKEDSK